MTDEGLLANAGAVPATIPNERGSVAGVIRAGFADRSAAADDVVVAADLLERLYLAVSLPAIPDVLWRDICRWIGAQSVVCEPSSSLGAAFRFELPDQPAGSGQNASTRVVGGGAWLRLDAAPWGAGPAAGVVRERLYVLARHLLVALALRRRIHAVPRALPTLVVGDREIAPRAVVEGLAAGLGITRAEAKLAIGLAAGHTVTSYCATVGIRTGTARCHLKSINRKVGTHNQISLVRLVLATLHG
jgi:hypothetical protein